MFGLEELLTREYIATIIDTNDPDKRGRVRVAIHGLLDSASTDAAGTVQQNANGILTEFLPWATPKLNSGYGANGAGSISIPTIGTKVKITFNNGDLYSPEYSSAGYMDPNAHRQLTENHENTQQILFDSKTATSIRFQPNSGLIIEHKGSQMTVNSDSSITISYDGGQPNITINQDTIKLVSSKRVSVESGSETEVTSKGKVVLNGNAGIQMNGNIDKEVAVNGKALMDFLNLLCQTIDNVKSPQTPGVLESALNVAQSKILNTKVTYNRSNV